MTEGTLVYLFRDNQILLAMKKRGFGVGKWNGVGGKLQAGETFLQAAMRETKEEIEVDVTLGEPHGLIHFHDASSEWFIHVFRSTTFRGEPKETEAMRQEWYGSGEVQ